MTRDIPILFSAPMVQAILEGRKTQTRRLVQDVPDAPHVNCHPSHKQKHPAPYLDAYCSDKKTALNPRGMSDGWCWWQVDDRQCLPTFKVRWKPGDRLWIKETWADTNGEAGPMISYRAGGDRFLTDDSYPVDYSRYPGCTFTMWCSDLRRGEPGHSWRPSIHMPRWASRITLLVTDVRVQRVQDISEEDAIAEGMVWQDPTAEDLEWYAGYAEEHGFDPKASPMEGVWLAPGSRQGYGMTKAERDRPKWAPTARHAYRFTWEAINRPGSWDANPWVAAISFERVT